MPTATVAHARLDELHVIRIEGSVRRTLAAPAPADTERWPYLMVCTVSGVATLDHGGRSGRSDAGELALVANDAELSLATDDDAVVLLARIPAGALGPYGRALGQNAGRRWTTASGVPALVAGVLHGLSAQAGDASPLGAGQLARHIVGLVAALCADAIGQRSGFGDRTLLRAKEYIEDHLGELDLSPERVAAAHNISVRTLHRLFESEQHSVGGWIRAQRLEHCRSDLEDIAQDREPVSAIGARWGFWDAAHFSRLFKARYRMSPRAYRATRGERVLDDRAIA
jgi:AraC-like DNA-binding protein